MARRPKAAPVPKPNAIVASAARVIAGRRKNMPKGGAIAWQAEAWEMLDVVGELEFYREWIANALSRCTLKVVEDTLDAEGQPTTVDATDPMALAALAALYSGEAGQPEMLSTMGGHLAIPGETWLCGLLNPPTTIDAPDTWRVLSQDEVSEMGTGWQIDRGDGEAERHKADEVYMTRIWEPHPRKWVHANSSVRSALPILRELVGLSKRQAAIIDSRLAGNGILVVPSEITFASPATPDENGENDGQDDPFMVALLETIAAAIADPGDASALAPLVIKAPAEHLDKIKHLSLASPLDDKAIEQRKELIQRLANSLNVPAEVLLGLADVNHWSGWLLDENAIKMHVEPILGTITRGLTTRYLWPVLQGDENTTLDPALRRFRIVGDTAALRQRPNRAAEANTAHTELKITDAAWARETGFDTTDLLDPQSDEYRRRVLMSLARSSDPMVVIGALRALGVQIEVDVAPEPVDGATQSPAALPSPGVPTGPTNDDPRTLPEQPTEPPSPTATAALLADATGGGASPSQTAAVLAVAELLVLRAVERGWNRAGRRGRVRRPVEAEHLDAALDGAWSNVRRSASLCGVDPDRFQSALDEYARGLLLTGDDHDPHALLAVMVAEVVPA